MDDSFPAKQATEDNGTGRFRGGMARALLSAAVFGTLGAYAGKWLGKRGNADKNPMAETIMKWSMGVFSAVLAAYSSLKASEPLPNEQAPNESKPKAREKQSTIRDYSTVADMNQAPENIVAPSTQVQKATAAVQGLVQENVPQMVAQK
jgi:hypothetical protein